MGPQSPYLISKSSYSSAASAIQEPQEPRSRTPGHPLYVFRKGGLEDPGLHLSALQLSESDGDAAAILAGVALATGSGQALRNTQWRPASGKRAYKGSGRSAFRPGAETLPRMDSGGLLAGFLPAEAQSFFPAQDLSLLLPFRSFWALQSLSQWQGFEAWRGTLLVFMSTKN